MIERQQQQKESENWVLINWMKKNICVDAVNMDVWNVWNEIFIWTFLMYQHENSNFNSYLIVFRVLYTRFLSILFNIKNSIKYLIWPFNVIYFYIWEHQHDEVKNRKKRTILLDLYNLLLSCCQYIEPNPDMNEANNRKMLNE